MNIDFNHGGKLYLHWDINGESFSQLDIPDEDKQQIITNAKWHQVRDQRNKLIIDTDWTQLADNGLSDEQRNDYKIYRQALRDLPENNTSPDEILWPVLTTA